MRIDLRPLLAGDRELSFNYEFDLDIDSADTTSVLYGASFPSPMKVKGDITNTAGYMRMTISASIDYSTSCARCLSPINGVFELNLEKTVASKDLLGNLNDDIPDDYAIIEDGFLDMDEPLREQIEMEFPVRFLCKDDCKGLCSKCGHNLNKGDCGCQKKEIDPRLVPLAKILEQMTKEEK